MEGNKENKLIAISYAARTFLDFIDNIIYSEDDRHLSTSDSSSDESVGEEILIQCTSIRRKPGRIEKYVENVIPQYIDNEFKQHFRLSRNAFNILLRYVAQNIKQERDNRIDLEKQLLAVLWILATPDSYRSVGDRFDVAKSSLSMIFVRIINAINKIAPTIIHWPSTSEMTLSKIKFKEMCGVDNVIGVIDGTYVRIKPPADQYQSYTNRKMFQSMTLQAVCDQNMKYLDCFTGYPSSVHDSRVFRNSDLYENVQLDKLKYFPTSEVILGDKAYTLSPWLITPYLDRGRLTQAQKSFNKKHASGRQIIERSFAHLFGRFRRLQYLNMNRIDWVPATILACCVLHNICLNWDDSLDEYISEGSITANECNTTDDESQSSDLAAEMIREQLARNST